VRLLRSLFEAAFLCTVIFVINRAPNFGDEISPFLVAKFGDKLIEFGGKFGDFLVKLVIIFPTKIGSK